MISFHWTKSVQMGSFFWSVFSHIRNEYREIRIHSECEKYGPKETPYLDTFHAVSNYHYHHHYQMRRLSQTYMNDEPFVKIVKGTLMQI